MRQTGPIDGLASQAAADAAGDLNPARFLGYQPNADRLGLLIEFTTAGAGALVVHPVMLIRDGAAAATQFEVPDQELTVNALGAGTIRVYRELEVPPFWPVALRVVSIAGGASVSIRGFRAASGRV